MLDVSSAFQGLSASLPQLLSNISELGWSVKTVKFDKKSNSYLASATNTAGEEIEKSGSEEIQAVANLLIAISRRNSIRSVAKTSMWKYKVINEQKEIAEAYVKAPVYDPKAAVAFKELSDDATHRAKVLEEHLKIVVVNNPEPYTDADKMAEDITKRKKLMVSRANPEHPIWTPDQVIAFRIVFDVLGYSVAGAGWDWRGDNLAFNAFAPLISANAQKALFTEVIGQSAYMNTYRAYGPQKICILKEFIERIQEKEEIGPNYHGTHPSQTPRPVEAPEVKEFKPEKDAPYPLPDHRPILSSNEYADPNAFWTPEINPIEPNAYLDHGDPIGYTSIMNNAQALDTGWSKFKTGDNSPDYDRMKLAIVNAFRAALLSPRKDFRWNTIHYQDIQNLPASTTDPGLYYQTLEKKRQDWNASKFGEESRYEHKIYAELVPAVENIVYKLNPEQGYEKAKEATHRMIENWLTEEQNHIAREDEDRSPEQQMTSHEVEAKSFEKLFKRIKIYIKNSKKDMDFRESGFEEEQFGVPDLSGMVVNPYASKYGGFMNKHLKSIAQVSTHADELLEAALEDVKEHNGTGHHFRAAVMQMGIPHVGQKVASFAWLLLQPLTSELATIDTHVMKMLGKDYAKDMNVRDYARFERELAVGRDAAGYNHLPLGAFTWGLWDHSRNGEGSYQDHSGLRVIDPTPYDKVEFLPAKGTDIPDWWKNTQAQRDQIGEQWNTSIAPEFNSKEIPYRKVNPPITSSFKTATKEQFEKQWNKRTPIEMKHAKILGQYAAAAKLSKDEAEDYVENHDFDVKPGFPDTVADFKREFIKYFDKYHQSSHSSAVVPPTPWFKHSDGQTYFGEPGQTIMQHARNTLGLSTPEVWMALNDVGKS